MRRKPSRIDHVDLPGDKFEMRSEAGRDRMDSRAPPRKENFSSKEESSGVSRARAIPRSTRTDHAT